MGTKAGFRAAREGIGLTQQNIADMAGVNVMTVKRWEKPGGADVPEDVEDLLEEQLELFDTMVDGMVDQFREIVGRIGSAPAVLNLTYFRNQADYDLHGRDPGVYSFVNAATREAACRIEGLFPDITIEYCYPEDKPLPY